MADQPPAPSSPHGAEDPGLEALKQKAREVYAEQAKNSATTVAEQDRLEQVQLDRAAGKPAPVTDTIRESSLPPRSSEHELERERENAQAKKQARKRSSSTRGK